MDYPKYIEIDNEICPINTSFKVALECNNIAKDETIGDFERTLAIIYKLFGEKALNDSKNYDKYLELAIKYLSCGQELNQKDEEQDMDFNEDYKYIKASFRSDYNMDIDKENLHWWEFYELINGLSNSDIGNCCILNRIRNLRNYDTSKIEDNKERQKIEEAKESVALKCNEKKFTKEQEDSIEKFMKIAKIRKE